MPRSLNGLIPGRRRSVPSRVLASASGFGASVLRTRLPVAALVALLWGAGIPGTAQAQEAADTVRWRNTSELSFLVNGGNAIQSSLGFRNSLRRTSGTGQLRVDAATFRTDATRVERTAVGAPGDFQVEEERQTERTAERWSAQGRYDRNLNRILFASGSAGWERNTFAGFNSRTIASVGAGARLSREDVWDFKIGAGLTYTFQDDVNPDPDGLTRFGGLRGTLDYEHQLATSTVLEMKWVVDANAQEWENVRGDLSQSIATSLTDRLALKTTLQLLLDNDPPFQRVPLVSAEGEDTGSTVLVPLGKRDQVISLALVLTL